MLPGLTPEEAQKLLLSVGTHHGERKCSPVEIAEMFQKAIRAGATPLECARFVRLTGPTMVARFLRLLRLSPSIRHNVDWGQTGATMAFAAAWRLGDLNEDEQETAAMAIIANQMKKEEVRQIVQLRKRSRRGIEECVADVIRMRPHITKKHVFLGAVTDVSTCKWLAGLQQLGRDEILASVLKGLYGALPQISGRLGTERFTIVTDDVGAARIKAGGGAGFEVAINEALTNKVSTA